MAITRLGRGQMGAWGRGEDLVSAYSTYMSHLIEYMGCHGVWGGQAEGEGLTDKKASLSCAEELGLTSLG